MLTRVNDSAFWAAPPGALVDALELHEDPAALIRALLLAADQSDVKLVREGTRTVFEIVHEVPTSSPTPGPLVALADDGLLYGTRAGELEAIYQIVRGIESDLSSAVFLPPELRARRIAEFCSDIGVSEERFRQVLKRWTRPSFLVDTDAEGV